MNITNNNIEFYIDKINNNEHFSFSRWGDGEWFCTMGRKGKNCDNHSYFPELSDGLNHALKYDKGYYKAIWNTNHGQIKNILGILLPFLDKNKIQVNWVNAGIWEDAAINGELDNLIESLEKRNYVIVSNESLKKLNIKYIDYITIPSQNCFLEKDRIKEEMIKISQKYDDVVFGMSSSMATNVIIDELYDVIGDKCTMIDFGSIWDPFVGKLARTYHKQYKKKTL